MEDSSNPSSYTGKISKKVEVWTDRGRKWFSQLRKTTGSSPNPASAGIVQSGEGADIVGNLIMDSSPNLVQVNGDEAESLPSSEGSSINLDQPLVKADIKSSVMSPEEFVKKRKERYARKQQELLELKEKEQDLRAAKVEYLTAKKDENRSGLVYNLFFDGSKTDKEEKISFTIAEANTPTHQQAAEVIEQQTEGRLGYEQIDSIIKLQHREIKVRGRHSIDDFYNGSWGVQINLMVRTDNDAILFSDIADFENAYFDAYCKKIVREGLTEEQITKGSLRIVTSFIKVGSGDSSSNVFFREGHSSITEISDAKKLSDFIITRPVKETSMHGEVGPRF